MDLGFGDLGLGGLGSWDFGRGLRPLEDFGLGQFRLS